MASTAPAGKAASSITCCVVSLTASAAFSVPLLPAGGVATGAAASHADASLLAFSISAFQGFDGTENHESLGTFVDGSACFTSCTLATTGAGRGGSLCFTRATSSTAVAVSVEIFSCETGELAVAHGSFPNGGAAIVPMTGAVFEITAGAAGVSFTTSLAAGAVSTISGLSSTGAHESTGIFFARICSKLPARQSFAPLVVPASL